jgi:hypothetical protein
MPDVTPKHGLGWQDAQMAQVVRCGKTAIPDMTLDADSDPRRCPVCGKLLRLVWDVRIEEAPDA